MVTNNAINVATGATNTVLTGQGVGSSPTFSGTPTVTSITFGSGSALSTFLQAQSFTPVLNFGGGTTGITYTVQSGKYTQLGNAILYSVNILLSSKGSSTGAATITGWPVSIGGNNAMAAINYWGNITLTALNTVISGSYVSGTTMTLTQTGSAQAASGMDNTMFANTSFLYFTGVYFTS